MTYKVKILKETPFDKVGMILTIKELRLKYAYLFHKSSTDDMIVTYLKVERQSYLEDLSDGNHIGKFFSLIEDTYKVGDWVWHSELYKALLVVEHTGDKSFYPMHVTLNDSNQFSCYTRLATDEEILFFSYFTVGTHDDVLFSKAGSYYYDHIWKPLQGVSYLIKSYMSLFQLFLTNTDSIKCNEVKYQHGLNGFKIGCKTFSHGEVAIIAKKLDISL